MSGVRTIVIAALALAACKKDNTDPPAPPPAASAAPATASDGARRVAIEASDKGYQPDRVEGKPNEKLVLVFTRTIEAECLEKVRLPDGKTIELPMRKPVEAPVTVPASGELAFACGMDMFHGTIVAKP
jgi:plastocyanin domain-containing protein